VIEPVDGFLDLCESQGVFPACERTFLKMLKAVNHDDQKVFVVQTIDADLLDRTVLEMDLPENLMWSNGIFWDFRCPHFVFVTCPTRVQADDLGEPVGSDGHNPF